MSSQISSNITANREPHLSPRSSHNNICPGTAPQLSVYYSSDSVQKECHDKSRWSPADFNSTPLVEQFPTTSATSCQASFWCHRRRSSDQPYRSVGSSWSGIGGNGGNTGSLSWFVGRVRIALSSSWHPVDMSSSRCSILQYREPSHFSRWHAASAYKASQRLGSKPKMVSGCSPCRSRPCQTVQQLRDLKCFNPHLPKVTCLEESDVVTCYPLLEYQSFACTLL